MCSSVYQDFPFHQSWYQTYRFQMGAKNISNSVRNTSNLIKHVQNKYFFSFKIKVGDSKYYGFFEGVAVF